VVVAGETVQQLVAECRRALVVHILALEDPQSLNRRDIVLWAGHFGDMALALDAMRSLVANASAAVYLWLPQLRELRQSPEFKTLLRVAHWDAYGWPAICRRLDANDFACD
jgi:hypothetical protein